jgi:hypothetical protein
MSQSSSQVVPDKGNVTDEVTQALSDFLTNSSYACGGTLDVQQSDVGSFSASNASRAVTVPVTIRWDSASSIEKITLPLPVEQSNDDNSKGSFLRVLSRLALATKAKTSSMSRIVKHPSSTPRPSPPTSARTKSASSM